MHWGSQTVGHSYGKDFPTDELISWLATRCSNLQASTIAHSFCGAWMLNKFRIALSTVYFSGLCAEMTFKWFSAEELLHLQCELDRRPGQFISRPFNFHFEI